jgi:hypothetical protein
MLRGFEMDHFLWKHVPMTRLRMLLSRSPWVPYLVVVGKHGTLNSTGGVIFCLQVDRWLNEEVHVGPTDQYISHPRRTARNPLATRTMFLI